jgi:putative DNA primase/helicase
MRRRGMGAEEIEAALLVTNNKRCDPPLATDEVKKIASSVCRYKPAREAAFRYQG